MQGVILAGALAVIAGALLYSQHRPFDADTLRIQAEALQSQAAEVEAAAALTHDGVLAPRISSNHLEQLRSQVQRTRDTLRSKAVPAHLAVMHARILHAVDQVETRVVALQHRPPR